MTTNEMLVFCGSVLGPALVAREVAESLRRIPALGQPKPADLGEADRLLREVFPRGLEL